MWQRGEREHELYDAPKSEWVMWSSWGRVLRLGFEVGGELVEGDGTPVRVRLSRGEAERLELVPGDIVWGRAAGRAPAVATMS